MKYLILFIIFFLSFTNSYTFLHISDIHFDSLYSPNTPNNCVLGDTGMGCCRNDSMPLSPYNNASVWGDYNCDTPYSLLYSTINWINDNLDFDFVIYTGDSVDHNEFVQNYSKNLYEIETVAKLLSTLNKPIFPVLGNHDTWPIDQLYPINGSIPPFYNIVLTDIANIYLKNFNFSTDMYNTFKKGGYYTNDFLVATNSLFYDKNNMADYFCPNCDFQNQNEFIQNSLKTPKFVIGHIPPGAGEAVNTYTNFITNISDNYPVLGFLFGHSHIDEFRLLKKDNIFSSVVFLAPSLVPNHHFPTFRRYITDNNLVISNYEQYALNLTKTIETNKIDYYISYTPKSLYDMNDLSSESFVSLYKEFSYNDTLFQNFMRNYNVGFYTYCDTNCKNDILCDIAIC